jgi:hypothetical protein
MKWARSTKMGKLVLAVGLLLGIAWASPTYAQGSDPVSVVDAFHAAGDDMEAALALLTDDVVIELKPAPPNTTGIWTGKKEAQAFFEWRNANNIRRMREGSANVDGIRISGYMKVTSNTFDRLKLGAVAHIFQAEVVDGKLKYYRGQLAAEEQARVSAAFLAAQQASAEQPVGMPRTGSPILPATILLAGVGMMLTLFVVGVALRRRGA